MKKLRPTSAIHKKAERNKKLLWKASVESIFGIISELIYLASISGRHSYVYTSYEWTEKEFIPQAIEELEAKGYTVNREDNESYSSIFISW